MQGNGHKVHYYCSVEPSGIFLITFVILCLSGAMVAFIYFFLIKRIQFSKDLKMKDSEKDLAVKQTAFSTQEAERKRIGEDLHDDIGPQLGLMKMQLSMIKMKHPDLRETLAPLSNQLNDTMKHVREVSHDLVPTVLYELGLTIALKGISSQLDIMVGLESSVYMKEGMPPIDKKKELAIYRIVQESVNNAIKHANASQIDIYLTSENGQLIAKVIDNGSGIAEDKKDIAGLGLTSMRERAIAFNGSIILDSGIDKGTTVLLKLPL